MNNTNMNVQTWTHTATSRKSTAACYNNMSAVNKHKTMLKTTNHTKITLNSDTISFVNTIIVKIRAAIRIFTSLFILSQSRFQCLVIFVTFSLLSTLCDHRHPFDGVLGESWATSGTRISTLYHPWKSRNKHSSENVRYWWVFNMNWDQGWFSLCALSRNIFIHL